MGEGLAGIGPGFVYPAFIIGQQKRAGGVDSCEFTHIFDQVFFDKYFPGHTQVLGSPANIFRRKYRDRGFAAIGT